MKKILFLLCITVLSSSCSTMNNDFSCNLTASDHCLNLDEVNAMTEDKDRQISEASRSHASVTIPEGSRKIWIAPWKEANGTLHQGEYVHVPMNTATAVV